MHAADAQMVGQQRDAPPAVAAHGGFASVGIEIAHAELRVGIIFENHQAVGPYAGPAVAQGGHALPRGVENLGAPVDDDEVVAGSVVFVESLFHAALRFGVI